MTYINEKHSAGSAGGMMPRSDGGAVRDSADHVVLSFPAIPGVYSPLVISAAVLYLVTTSDCEKETGKMSYCKISGSVTARPKHVGERPKGPARA